MDLIQQLTHYLTLKKTGEWDTTTKLEFEEMCFSLSKAEAETLTQYATSLKRTQDALEILDIVAVVHPSVLGGIHDKYLSDWASLLHPVLYRGANSQTRDKLLSALSSEPFIIDLENILGALVWIGDEVVKEHLQKWLIEPPPW